MPKTSSDRKVSTIREDAIKSFFSVSATKWGGSEGSLRKNQKKNPWATKLEGGDGN